MNLRIIQRFRHTIVALEESSAEDASFFQAEICFTFGRIFVYKRKFFYEWGNGWFIMLHVLFVQKHSSSLICSSEHINGIFNFGLHFCQNNKYWTGASNRPRVTTLKLIFPAVRTPFSFQAFAPSPLTGCRELWRWNAHTRCLVQLWCGVGLELVSLSALDPL